MLNKSSVQFYRSMMKAGVKLDVHDILSCANVCRIVLLIRIFLRPGPLPFTILIQVELINTREILLMSSY